MSKTRIILLVIIAILVIIRVSEMFWGSFIYIPMIGHYDIHQSVGIYPFKYNFSNSVLGTTVTYRYNPILASGLPYLALILISEIKGVKRKYPKFRRAITGKIAGWIFVVITIFCCIAGFYPDIFLF